MAFLICAGLWIYAPID